MLKYLICGVLDTLDEHNGTHTIHKDVVWGHRPSRVYVWEPKEETTTDGHAHHTVIKMVTPKDGEAIAPYGYSCRRHAVTGIKRMLAKGKGYRPLLNVHSLTPVAVLLLADGSWQLGEEGSFIGRMESSHVRY